MLSSITCSQTREQALAWQHGSAATTFQAWRQNHLLPTPLALCPGFPQPFYSPGTTHTWARLGSTWEGMGWVNPTLASHLMPPSPAALEERAGDSCASTCFNCPVPPHPTRPLSYASVSLCVPACHSSSKEIPVFSSLPSLRRFPAGQATFPISAVSPQGLGHAHPASSISGTAVKSLGHKLNP